VSDVEPGQVLGLLHAPIVVTPPPRHQVRVLPPPRTEVRVNVEGQGLPGPPGPQGPPGPSGDGGVTHVQLTPVDTYVFNHNLNRPTIIQVFNAGGLALGCEIEQLSLNAVRLSFNTPQAFTATVI
jgi:hypothetical protein